MENITGKIYRSASGQDRKAYLVESLYESLPFIYIAIIVFIIGIVFGFHHEETIKPFVGEIFDFADSHLIGRGIFLSILFIFLKNYIAAILCIFLGFAFGIIPLISSFINGAVVGGLAAVLIRSEQAVKLFLLIPHGLFELPAFFIACGTGIWFGSYLLRKNRDETFENRRIRATLLSVLIIPLFFLAAIIEAGLFKILN